MKYSIFFISFISYNLLFSPEASFNCDVRLIRRVLESFPKTRPLINQNRSYMNPHLIVMFGII